MNVGIHCTNIARVIDEFRARPIEASAADFDKKFADAVHADAQEQMSAMISSIAESCKVTGTQTHMNGSIMTSFGRIVYKYPYTPNAGVLNATLIKLGCEPGKVRATPEARRIIVESAAQLDSFGEAQIFLKANTGIDISVSSIIALTRDAAEKTRLAWMEDKLVENIIVRPTNKIPKNARYVGFTIVIMVDGTCAPCTHTDTDGIKGKDGDEAGTREIKVVAIAIYTHVDQNGRPILQRGNIWYFASHCSSNELESIMNMLARRRGIGKIQRVQFIGDGAIWIQKIWEHAFKNCGAIRTLDFVHATSYLHQLLETVSAAGELNADYKRFKGILKKWGGTSLMKNLSKKFGEALDKIDGNAKKALTYLREREGMMNYRILRKLGYYIGSGIVESACKTIVGARCKLAGMHWRHKNAAGIALLRATLRSNFKISA